MTHGCCALRFDQPIADSSGDMVGRLARVCIDPDTRRVLGLVIDRGLARPDIVAPASAIIGATQADALLQLTSDALRDPPSLPARYAAADVRAALQRVASEALPQHLTMLRAGQLVRTADGVAERLDQVIARLPDLTISELVVRSGRLRESCVRVPASAMTAVSQAAVELGLTHEQLHALPAYRPDAELVAVVRQAMLADAAMRRADARTIAIEARNGVVTLRGYVTDGRNRDRAEQLARDVRGVLRVENALVSDAELLLDVAQALARDERTRGAAIGVNVMQGIVYLIGEARSPALRSAAEEVAAHRPRVRMVVNQLIVPGLETDEAAPLLLPRPGQSVFATDGPFGRVERVVVSPRSRRVTAMMVRSERSDPSAIDPLLGSAPVEARVVALPVSMIADIGIYEIFLNVNCDTAWNAPLFDPTQYVAPDAGWEPPFPYALDEVLLDLHRQRALRRDLQRAPRGWLESSPATAQAGAWIARDDLVIFRDGDAGLVDQVLLDPGSGSICHLVVRAGMFFHRDTVIPAEWIRSVDHGTIFVDAGAQQLAALPLAEASAVSGAEQAWTRHAPDHRDVPAGGGPLVGGGTRDGLR